MSGGDGRDDSRADDRRDDGPGADDGHAPDSTRDDASDEGSYVEEHGFLSWIDLDVLEAETGRVVMQVPYNGKLANLDEGGTIHGGIVATLIDTASGHVLRTTFEDTESVRMATVDLNVSYVRPARNDLTATATVVRAGESMGVTEVTVRSRAPDGQEKTVAVGRTTYRLFRGE